MPEIYIPQQFQGIGENQMLVRRSNLMDLTMTTHTGPPLREKYTRQYGPQTTRDNPDQGGWYPEVRTPQSVDEHLMLNSGYEPVEIYVTMAGLIHMAEHRE